jgi:uncharacterized protein YbjT (DUF2867 family)
MLGIMKSSRADTVLVTAGTGKIGREFVTLMARDARAPRVRVTSRDPSSRGAALLRALDPERVEPVVFDVERPETMRAALDGVTKLFVIAPFIPDMRAWHAKVAEAAKAAGSVEFAVKVSVTGARGPTSDPPPGGIPLAHWQGEQALLEAGLRATMIRPTIFMQHFGMSPGLFVAGAERFFLPTGEARVAWLDCRDIAAMAAALVLADPATRAPYEGNAYELTGPRAHTARELGEILSLVAGRTVAHVDGAEAFSARCKELGVPDSVKGIYAEAAGGWFGKVEHDAFTSLQGRSPTPFAKFALDNAAFFGGTVTE